MPRNQTKTLEDHLYEQQYKKIKQECGVEAADRANYGWGVIDDPNFLDVSTKVYGEGVLRSVANRNNGKITHEFN